jgi:nucleoside-diphosphate-sugar epimerase
MIGPQSCVVVTGGSGFIGGALARRLLGCGAVVRVISRGRCSRSWAELAPHQQRAGQLQWIEGDLAGEPADISAAFAGATHVFHVAGLVDSAAPRAAFEAANVRATQRVCEMALANGVARLVYVSTCDVFGLPVGGAPICERTPYRPWGESYPDTKIAATRIVQSFQLRGLQSSIVYPGWVYGPGDRAFLPTLVAQVESGLMPIWSPAGFQIHLIYIEDLVDAMMAIAVEPKAANDDFLVLDDASGVEMADVCDRIAADFGWSYRKLRLPYAAMHVVATLAGLVARAGLVKKPLLTTTDVKSFGHHFRYSAAKVATLGWRRQTAFAEGMRAALAWHRQHMMADVPVAGIALVPYLPIGGLAVVDAAI